MPMETTRLSSKGQIIPPKTVRDANHWQAGTEFFVEETAGGVLLRPVKSLPASQIEGVAGRLARHRSAPDHCGDGCRDRG